MNPAILNSEVQEFINANLDADISKLLLKGSPFKTVSIKELVGQIEAKRKCIKKLPTWFLTKNIYYPNKLNIEQTSSEATANYKSQLIKGDSLIDVTGGFGVDTFCFSKNLKSVAHCEINEFLSKIVAHNYEQLGINNIELFSEDGLEHLKRSKKKYDWIYVDPSRRHDSKGKVFFLKDCLPDVPENLDVLFEHSNNIMIKTSPLLDISVGISELKCVKMIHVVALENEVKELLWILEKDFSEEITIKTVNLKKDKNEAFAFKLAEEKHCEVSYSLPLSYLYEPNSAILKAGGFNSVAKGMVIFKLHKHSHLYTSESIIENFPGRSFKIETIKDYSKSSLKSLNIKKANITTRNFSESVSQLRKKLKISEGGDIYLFFSTNLLNKKVVLISRKIN